MPRTRRAVTGLFVRADRPASKGRSGTARLEAQATLVNGRWGRGEGETVRVGQCELSLGAGTDMMRRSGRALLAAPRT